MSEKESPSMKALRIVYGDEVIVVQCVPRQVVKGRVLIKVHPDCRVIVSVPPETPEHELLSALKKRGRWIYQQLRDFREQQTHIVPR
ncbi:YgjP-like metallopeptidase domain-containing protein, partial [Acinetobacter baumannii]